MKTLILIIAFLFLSCMTTAAQSVSNDVLRERIRIAGAENSITVEYDAAGKTTKLMATSENFSKSDASRAGILAMNFAIGVIYAGDSLSKEPESFLFAFWVLSKKARFSENHAMTAALSEEMLVIGSARYVAKPREQMEYLNYEVSRENLAKIASGSNVRFQLGNQEFTFTKSQMKLLADILAVTETKN